MDQVIVFAYQVARKVLTKSANDTTCETRVAWEKGGVGYVRWCDLLRVFLYACQFND